MIDNKFLQRIGLTDDQIILLREAMDKENRFRTLLFQEGLLPGSIDPVLRVTRFEDVDLSNEELLREKIREEYKDFIRKR